MDALVRIRTHTAAPAARALFASVGRACTVEMSRAPLPKVPG
jgi:hypothetical protein